VADIAANFEQRWNACTDRIAAGFPTLGNSNTLPFSSNLARHYVQVTRTFARKAGKYPFAPRGEYGTLHAVIRAVNRARRFIYMEEQYAYPYPADLPYDASQDDTGLTFALRNALARIEFLLILIPNYAGVLQDRKRRETFIGALKEVAPTKVFVFYLKKNSKATSRTDHEADLDDEIDSENALFNNGTVDAASAGKSGGKAHRDEVYVHTKAWFIDDVYVKIGSANVGRRSLTFDSELDIHVIDGALTNGSRRFALGLRRDLWSEHLGRPVPDDPAAGLELWKNPGPNPRVLPYEEHKSVRWGGDPNWNANIDPFGDIAGGDAKP
jgi:phosphatidylserine/phosphatidylglycerophosphate/cardiolipin synthase-like enzyme